MPVSVASDGSEAFGMARRGAGRCTTGINTSTCITLAISSTSKVNAMAGRGQAVLSRAIVLSAHANAPRSRARPMRARSPYPPDAGLARRVSSNSPTMSA